MSTNHNHDDDPPINGGNGGIDPCSRRIKEEAEYNRKVRCQHCKLIFCIIASVAVAAGIVLLISGAVALWPPAQEDDDNLPLILTVPQQCCQDNDDDDDDRDYKHKHKDKHHHNDNDDDD